MHFEGQNYLLKMRNDTQIMLNTQTMKMWLGFDPNMFMLPPPQHSPHKLRVEREELRRSWIRGRDAWMQAQLDNLRQLAGANISSGRYVRSASRDNVEPESATTRRSSIVSPPPRSGSVKRSSIIVTPNGMIGGMVVSQSAPVLTQSGARVVHHTAMGVSHSAVDIIETSVGESERRTSSAKSTARSVADRGVSAKKGDESCSDGDDDSGAMLAPKIHGSGRVDSSGSDSDSGSNAEQQENDTDSHSDTQSESATSSSINASSSTYSRADEDWQLLRDQCSSSWPSADDPTASNFWSNYDLNPLTVEAAVCFVDAFPTIFIVPPVPLALQNRCSRYLTFPLY